MGKDKMGKDPWTGKPSKYHNPDGSFRGYHNPSHYEFASGPKPESEYVKMCKKLHYYRRD
ncbi:MAG: hypothetical protein GTN36_00075 [Candidatus Aenigmarchaeota archaeon]|nr:hypothetical protein [Candidatus Aenigmarchaeota archaeon]